MVGASTSAFAEVKFNRDIRPIMSDTCFHCHGPDAKSRKGGLRLDIREEALKAGKSGAVAIVPGKPDDSEIIKRIFTHDEDDVMPPEEAHKELTKQQKETFRQWVAEGAKYEAHWAYTPLEKPPVPAIADRKSPAVNAIDAFIREKLAEKSIQPSAEADRRTLLRRLSLDLTGLPPTPAEVEAFVKDKSSRAYEKQVERLLNSPHFGERWAAWWLDVARFADTVGFHGDQNQRIFPYRDYVINAFNANKRFDQFTIEQLAGDLLPNATPEQIVATGFNRLNMMTREGGAQPKEYLAKYNADRVRTIGGAWLAATIGCAECHDHKFDPLTQKDFYAMQAVFADVKQYGVYSSYGYTPVPELTGYGNEHPFPPEIEVESAYLKQREARLHRELTELVTTAAKQAAASSQGKAARTEWLAASRKFLAAHPDGWLTPKPMVTVGAATPATTKKAAPKTPAKGESKTAKSAPAKPEPAKFELAADGRVVSLEKASSATTLRINSVTGWVAALRFELLPEARQGATIGRNGSTNSMALRLSATVRSAAPGAKDVPLTFRYADANLKDPRFKDGHEIIGIRDQWKTSAAQSKTPHVGVWLLEKPLNFAPGDVLTVKLDGNNAASVRLSVSPFAPRDPLSPNGMATLAEAVLKDSRKTRALADEAFVTGTGINAEALMNYNRLFAQVVDCRGGRAWTMVTKSAEPMTIRVLARGNWMDESGPVTPPASPGFLPGVASTPEKRVTRLEFAKWLCSKENPLTARAVANRVWKQFFGTGLSAVVDDLGAQGEPPSHPELLDWIASDFRDSGWDFKHLLKTIVMSATYRQSSSLRPELKDIDPNNRLLASQNPRRLDAEFVRDNALFVAGQLNLTEIGGPSVKPYQPAGYYANLQFPNRDYAADNDDRQWRRGLYMHWQRTFLHPMLANFDAPNRDECTANRNVSNTPQQALTLLNDPTFVEAARVFAANLLVSPAKSDDARIDLAMRRAVARSPKAKELASLKQFLAEQRAHYRANAEEADKLLKVGLAPQAPLADRTELAAWTSLCRVVLNLQETITRY